MCGSHTAMCEITSSSTSDGENCRARKPAIRSTAERSCSDVTACSDLRLCMAAYRKTGFDNAREHARANGQDLVVEDLAGIVHRDRAVMADPGVCAGHRLQ